ncbi:hypothetical protein [Streptomyces sulphureus]|uniref:hypothetical protein n=1 Tax=Streptomyces sulphureus TaxID=47758 RepID=UPI00036B8B2B|nr:hypothetical protein [Streptomyces sulphureus]
MLGLAVLAGVLVAVAFATRDSECSEGLQQVEESCMGVSAEDFAYDGELRGLVRSIAEENNRVAKEAESFQRIAVTMPFSSDRTSAMPLDLIQHGLAGAAAAQRAANEAAGGGPEHQLLLADIGRGMKEWKPVVKTLGQLKGNDDSPLIATAGLGSSTSYSKEFIEALRARDIPSMGPVITSSNMNADGYFFKNSPSNKHFVEALDEWLEDNPGDGDKHLVYDDHPKDTYSLNLRQKIEDSFGDEYRLRKNSSSFIGGRGEEAGEVRLFKTPVADICKSPVDTIFYVGRDDDLPLLVEELADSYKCGKKPLRILKVGIGLPPELTDDDLTKQMREARIVLVNAAAVDPEWPREKSKPTGFPRFSKYFATVAKKAGMDVDDPELLDDGYAVMYYDAVHTVTEASGHAFAEAGKDEQKTAARVRNNVRNKLLNFKPYRDSDGRCGSCVTGASGTYGFNQLESKGLWPVCKAVHILEYPAPKAARRGDGERSGKRAGPAELYRTESESPADDCPQDE